MIFTLIKIFYLTMISKLSNRSLHCNLRPWSFNKPASTTSTSLSPCTLSILLFRPFILFFAPIQVQIQRNDLRHGSVHEFCIVATLPVRVFQGTLFQNIKFHRESRQCFNKFNLVKALVNLGPCGTTSSVQVVPYIFFCIL